MNRIIITSLLLTLFFTPINAQIIRGAEFNYSSISGYKYHVTLKIYTFCTDYVATSYDIYETSNCGEKNFTLAKLSSKEISQTCDGVCTDCTQSTCTNYGFIETIYSGDLTLRNDTCCIRHLNLRILRGRENLVYLNDTFFMDCMINTCLASKNNSVSFNLDPLTTWQPHKVFYVSHGAFDSDFDSLSYEIVQPKTDSNSVYIDDPTLIRSLKIDSHTGLITYPGKYASGWIPVRVTEYRNNKKVGYVQRELQYFAINRNKKNAVPTLSGVNGTTKYSIDFCMGSENCFTISSSDSNTTDSVFLISNNTLSGLSVSVDNKKAQGATICWTPDPKLFTKSSYDITLRAFDNACPYNYYSDRNYTINLFQASAKPIYKVDSCGLVSFNTNLKVNKGDPKLVGIKWTGDDDFISDITNPNHHYSSSGKYFYSLTLFHKKTNCIIFKDSGFVNINRSTSIELPNDTLACQGDSFLIKPKNVEGYGLVKYKWNTGDTTGTIRVPVLSTRKYTLTIKDKIGCIDSAHFILTMRDPIKIGKLVDSTVCPTYDTIKLITNPSGGIWVNSLINNDSLLIPSINDSNSILYVEYQYLDKYSCTSKKTFTVRVLPLKLANGGGDISLCLNQENYQLRPVSNGIWEESPAIDENTILIKNLKIGENSLYYYLENEFGCLSVDTVIAVLHTPQKALITNADSFCQNKTIEFSGIPETGKWILEGDTLNFRFFKPSLNDSGWINVVYIGKDANMCYDTSFKDIYIVPVPEVSISGLENNYCITNDSFLIIGTPSGGVFSGNSIIEKNNNSFFVPRISGLGKTLIVYQVDNHNFCPSTDSAWIQVNNTPKADFEYTALNYSLPISVKFTDLSKGNPVKWSWSVVNSDLDSSYLQDPVFSFIDTISVFTSLTISDYNFCRDSIKKRINLSEFVGMDDLNHIDDIYIQIDYGSKKLTIKNNLVLNNVSVISIFSFDGKLTNQFFVNQNTREINLNNLPSGFYFLHAQTDKLNKIFLITL